MGFVEWQGVNFAAALHYNAGYQRAVLSYQAVTLFGFIFTATTRQSFIYARDAERHASLLLRYVLSNESMQLTLMPYLPVLYFSSLLMQFVLKLPNVSTREGCLDGCE